MAELDKKSLSNAKSWKEKYDNNVKFDIKDVNESWHDIFQKLFTDERMRKTENALSTDLQSMIHPPPDYVFNAFNLTETKNVCVVFIGQDPYFDHETFESKHVSQAMGLSFSVPHEMKIPSSLKNIYANLVKYNHITSSPKHGNLESWAKQGCLMLNSSLTVKDGTENKNCHKDIWEWFTDEIIKYISSNKNHVVFVLWGAFACKKSKLIDMTKHKCVISSHPSGLSANSPMGNYKSFFDTDCFAEINNHLTSWGKPNINWDNNVKLKQIDNQFQEDYTVYINGKKKKDVFGIGIYINDAKILSKTIKETKTEYYAELYAFIETFNFIKHDLDIGKKIIIKTKFPNLYNLMEYYEHYLGDNDEICNINTSKYRDIINQAYTLYKKYILNVKIVVDTGKNPAEIIAKNACVK